MTNLRAPFVCASILLTVPTNGYTATITFDNANPTQRWSDAINWDLHVLPADSYLAVLANSETIQVSTFVSESGYVRGRDDATLAVSNGSVSYGRKNNRRMLIGGLKTRRHGHLEFQILLPQAPEYRRSDNADPAETRMRSQNAFPVTPKESKSPNVPMSRMRGMNR